MAIKNPVIKLKFEPPNTWHVGRFRSIVSSLEEQTITRQTAIPWCTTHDVLANGDGVAVVYWMCWLGVVGGVDGKECVISTGGPDHKWWKDNGTSS